MINNIKSKRTKDLEENKTMVKAVQNSLAIKEKEIKWRDTFEPSILAIFVN